jgi:N-acetylgalactosamine kinase
MTEGTDTSSGRRVTRLVHQFARHYNRSPGFIVRAPGRVNLLGEHTDYNGLPVLPMAIDRNILIAGLPRADRVVMLQNVESQFGARQYELNEDIPPFVAGDWGNYAKAAAQGLMRYCGGRLLYGAELLVDGNIPGGAGLSSSSALVVGNALALLAANQIDLPYLTLAELLPVAERYVGTLSGGMDQATSLLAQQGHALRIDFFPLCVRTVPLPREYNIVVCHSLVQAEKSGPAKRGYNLRVIECRLACRVLERALGSGLPRPLHTLGDLATLFPGRPLVDFISLISTQLPDRPLSLVQVGAIIGTAPERLRSECHIAEDLGDRFTLLRRVRHVLREAERVDQAEKALLAGDAPGFGRLMDASHQSCRDDYEISCAELEELVHVAKEAGATGARLTGAGFGGCTVNLVAEAEMQTFLTRVDRSFYRSRRALTRDAHTWRFLFKPQSGAEVRRL